MTYTEWLTYTDEEYHFTMDYPVESDVSEKHDVVVTLPKYLGGDLYTTDKRISFTLGDGDPGSSGSVGVEIYEDTPFISSGGWYTEENHVKKNTGIPSEEYVYSMRIPDRYGPEFIDGYRAHTGYYTSVDTGAITNAKTTVVIKDGTLFKIRARFPAQADHEHV